MLSGAWRLGVDAGALSRFYGDHLPESMTWLVLHSLSWCCLRWVPWVFSAISSSRTENRRVRRITNASQTRRAQPPALRSCLSTLRVKRSQSCRTQVRHNGLLCNPFLRKHSPNGLRMRAVMIPGRVPPQLSHWLRHRNHKQSLFWRTFSRSGNLRSTGRLPCARCTRSLFSKVIQMEASATYFDERSITATTGAVSPASRDS